MLESKLEALLDFASYLKKRSRTEDRWAMETASMAYREWLGSENDVYDRVFRDELDIMRFSLRVGMDI